MMEDSICESFEPLNTLDLPHVPAHLVEPNSPPIPANVIEPEPQPDSSFIPTSVTHNFPRFSKVYSRKKVILELT